MKKEYSENDLRRILGQKLPESELLNGRMQETYAAIREKGQEAGRKPEHNFRRAVSDKL